MQTTIPTVEQSKQTLTHTKIHIHLPGRIVGAEGERTVIIEMPSGGKPVINAKVIAEIFPDMPSHEFDPLCDRVERAARCELIKAAIFVR